jgi:PAS domain S-box-containing protein
MIPPLPPATTAPMSPGAATPGRTSAQLAEEVRRIRELFAQAPGCMVVFFGPDHVVQMANPAYLKLSGLDDSIVGKPARVGLRRGYARGFGALLDEVYSSGKPKVIRGARLAVTRYPGGPDEEAFADFVLQPLREADGLVFGVFCQGHEVTNEKLANDELHASREALKAMLDEVQAMFDSSHDVICVFDAAGKFKHVNQHAELLWGYRPEELIGGSYLDHVHPDDLEITERSGHEVAAGVPTKNFLNRYIHKDGTAVPLMWSAVKSVSQNSIIGIARDMREHMAAEEKLRQAQKLEAIGRLTGGIAHDFNNLLTVVIGSNETLVDALDDHPELKAVANLGLDAAERGAELVSRLLASARSQPLAPQAVDCSKFLGGLLPILRRTISSAIEIDVEAPDEDLRCMADLTQLTSAMLNLCINARDAMPGGGRLTLSAVRRAPAGDDPAFVVLSVADTGEGMSPQTLARALEPFFTTKPEGQGSGLGLSMVHGFAGQSGGRLEIDSDLGRGTRISLFLPRTCRLEAQAPASLPTVGQTQVRHVLLVEDDDLLRDQVKRQLTSLGCRVTAHRNGHDALRRLHAENDVDLLMTDVVMPGGLNGRQLADQARQLYPDLAILFTSGHTDEPTIRALRMEGDAAFLGKPYRRGDLARKLADLFGGQPVAADASAASPSSDRATATIIAENSASTSIGLEITSVIPAAR